LPAYALDCLDEVERQSVADHLASCEVCRKELSGHREVLGVIAASLEQVDPPERVKASLMERVSAELPERRVGRARGSWWERWTKSLAPLSPIWAFVGLALVVILGASNILLWRQMGAVRARLTPPLRVVALSGTELMPNATGLIVISRDGLHGTLVVDDLGQLSEDQEYQLWLIRDGERDSGGLISMNPDGYGWLYVRSPEPLASYSAFGVTIEPKGGSPGPTGDKVLGGDL
jgi:anti-sigma-K factor RskA